MKWSWWRESPPGGEHLLCALCLSDWLDWELDQLGAQRTPVPAVTFIPVVMDGTAGTAAVCVAHFRALKRARRALEHQRADAARNTHPAGKEAAMTAQQMPRAAMPA